MLSYYRFLYKLCYKIVLSALIDTSSESDRYTIYYAIYFTNQCVVQCVLTFLYNPSTRCNSSFPFHQKTADMRDIDDNIENGARGKASQIVSLTKYFTRQAALLHDFAKDVTDYFDKTFSMIPTKTQNLSPNQNLYEETKENSEKSVNDL